MKPRTDASPEAFKQALEQRLRSSARTGAEFARKRQLLVFGRFLARVVAALGDAVTLKARSNPRPRGKPEAPRLPSGGSRRTFPGPSPNRRKWASTGPDMEDGGGTDVPIPRGLGQMDDDRPDDPGELKNRHDHGSQYMSDHFQNEIAFLGIESSPAFVRAPEGNGCAERFIRTLKEQLLWLRTFDTVEEMRQALHAWLEVYNERWLIERHGHRTPAQVRRDLLATPVAA